MGDVRTGVHRQSRGYTVVKEEGVPGGSVLVIVSLVRNVNRAGVKIKFAVYVNTTAVQKIIYLRTDQRIHKYVADQLSVLEESFTDGRSERIDNVTEGYIEGRGYVTGVGTDVEQGDVK